MRRPILLPRNPESQLHMMRNPIRHELVLPRTEFAEPLRMIRVGSGLQVSVFLVHYLDGVNGLDLIKDMHVRKNSKKSMKSNSLTHRAKCKGNTRKRKS